MSGKRISRRPTWTLLGAGGAALLATAAAALAATSAEPHRPFKLSAPNSASPGCQIPPAWSDCVRQPLAANEKWRDVYDVWILEAANAYGVHPAFLKAVAHVESTMDARAGSNEAPNGLCAMEPKNAEMKLDGIRIGKNEYDLWLYRSSRPTENQVLTADYNRYGLRKHPVTERFCQAFKFWSPRGQIWAAASYLRELRSRTFSVEEKSKDAKIRRYPVDNILFSDLRDPFWVHRARWLVAMYNKGAFAAQQALDAYYRVNGDLPRDFGPAWELLSEDRWRIHTFKAIYDKNTGKLIRKSSTWELTPRSFHVGKCHVWKVAGLCGERPDGYLALYAQDFAFDIKTQQWYRVPAPPAVAPAKAKPVIKQPRGKTQ